MHKQLQNPPPFILAVINQLFIMKLNNFGSKERKLLDRKTMTKGVLPGVISRFGGTELFTDHL